MERYLIQNNRVRVLGNCSNSSSNESDEISPWNEDVDWNMHDSTHFDVLLKETNPSLDHDLEKRKSMLHPKFQKKASAIDWGIYAINDDMANQNMEDE